MPTYVYRREDGSTFEVEQRITEPALAACPTTGQKVARVISGAGLIFKGEGFYLTDYARKTNGKESSGKPETKSEDKNGSVKAEPAKPTSSEPKAA
jgi:putative FmdB family regulatory protein